MLNKDDPKYQSSDKSVLSSTPSNSNTSSTTKSQSTFLKRSVKDVSVSDTLRGAKETASGYQESINSQTQSIKSYVKEYWAKNTDTLQFLSSLDFSNPVAGLLSTLDATKWLENAGISSTDLNRLKDLYANRDGLSTETLTKSLANITGLDIINDANTVINKAQSTDWTSLDSILGLTGNLLGIPNLRADVSGILSNFASDLSGLLYGLGLDGLADAIADKYGKDAGFIKQLTDRFESYCYLANLPMIKLCIKYIGPGTARARVPDAEAVILRSYKYDTYSETNKVKLGNELLSVIGLFPNSFKTVNVGMNGKEVVTGSDLTPFTTMSKQAKEVIIAANKYVVECEIAGTYSSYKLKDGTLALYKNAMGN